MSNIAPFAPGVVRIRFNANYGNATNIMNRLFFTFTGQLDQTSGSALANTAQAGWNSNMAPILSTTYILDSITVTDLGSATGTQIEHPVGLPGHLAAADFLPANTNMCITGLINRRYRGGKPRWYQCGLHQPDLLDNQTFTSTAVGNWEAAMQEMVIAIKGFATTGGTVTNNVNLSLVEGYTWTEYTTSSGKTNYRKDMVYRTSAVTDVINAWTPLIRVSTQRKRGVN